MKSQPRSIKKTGVREISLGAPLVLCHFSLTHRLRFPGFFVTGLKALISLPFKK